MDWREREHERDSSCGGWESLACCNGEGERFPGANGPECNQCSNRSGGGTDAIKNKDCEIKAIPELLKLLVIKGSTVTTDAVGTQTQIMDQIFSQEGHILLMVKKNQLQSETCPDEETGKGIQKTGMISDMELTAEEAGRIKREHWAVENSGAPYLRREYDFSGIAGFY